MTSDVTINKTPSSPGLKLLLVCALALAMTIPALFIFAIVYDRSSRAETIRNEIANAAGGPQQVIGPVLAIPFETKDEDGIWTVADIALVFAEQGELLADLKVSTRKKSLFSVQVYESNLSFSAQYDLRRVNQISNDHTRIVMDQAQILIGVSDLRGALDDAWLSSSEQNRRKFEPFTGHIIPRNADDLMDQKAPWRGRVVSFSDRFGQVLSAPVAEFIQQDRLQIAVDLRLGGAQSISLIPFASSTKFKLSADWPHPGFGGDFLPDSKQISNQGFVANRTIPALASGLPDLAFASNFTGWDRHQNGMRVTLVEASSPYQYVSRSLKYALLFIGFIFLAYFLFEITSNTPVHAAQYVLVGLAQSVFYLLLLALSEHMGFEWAFLIAATAVVSLIGLYAGAVFGKQRTLPALALFSALYGLLFVLMRLEDFALLVGAIACLLAIGAAMWMTRNLQWYGPPSIQETTISKPIK